MSKNILFISEQKLKDSSMMSENIDPKQLLPIIKACQDRYMLPLLGTALFNKLQSLIEAENVTAPYLELLDDYLTDALIWYTLKELPMPLMFKYVNKGMMTRTAENAQPTNTEDFYKMRNWCEGFAESYAERAMAFLRANLDKFPEYLNPGSSCDTVSPAKTNYRTPFALGNNCKEPSSFEERYQGNNPFRYR